MKSITFTPRNTIIFFIVFESDTTITGFTLKDCLFGRVKLVINVDWDKYSYAGYGIGFGFRSEFSLTSGSSGKDVIIFCIDMSSLVHVDNKKKVILVLGKGPKQGLDHTKMQLKLNVSLIFQDHEETFV